MRLDRTLAQTRVALLSALLPALVAVLWAGTLQAATLSVTKSGSGAGAVNSNVGLIDCGTMCSDTFPDNSTVTLAAAPAAGSQFTGWLGACTGLAACQITATGAVTVSATFAPSALGPPRLDVDGTATGDALTDGLLLLRYLFGLSGSALVGNAVGPDGSRSSASQIDGYIVDMLPAYDIDGNGKADALTDGLLIIRYLFGLRGQGLIANAIGTGAIRNTAPQVEAKMQSFFAPFVIEPPLFSGTFTAPDRSTLATAQFPPMTGRPGYTLLVLPEATIFFDPADRTPVSAAAECAVLVIACFKPGERNIAGCLTNVPQCTTSTPWIGNDPMCCATACTPRYQELRLAGDNGPAAFTKAVFRAPSCMPGLSGYPAQSQP